MSETQSDALGVVFEARGGVYRVRLDDGRELVDASLRGRLKRGRPEDRVVVGDRVRVRISPDGDTIEECFERRTRLVRGGSSIHRPKIMAANLDRLVVVMSAARPDPHPATIDKLLVLGEVGSMECVLVVNKMDLEGAPEVLAHHRARLGATGYPVIGASAETGEGIPALAEVLCEGSSVLAGPSGVGKSSLIACVEPGLELRVADVSERTGTGRHTTVSSRLVPLSCGGFVADTPGFGDVVPWGFESAELAAFFPEFRPLVTECRFRECTHTHEPDCAVKAAVAEGGVHPTRYETYCSLLDAQER